MITTQAESLKYTRKTTREWRIDPQFKTLISTIACGSDIRPSLRVERQETAHISGIIHSRPGVASSHAG